MSTNKSMLQSINSAENQDAMKNQEGKKETEFSMGGFGKTSQKK